MEWKLTKVPLGLKAMAEILLAWAGKCAMVALETTSRIMTVPWLGSVDLVWACFFEAMLSWEVSVVPER